MEPSEQHRIGNRETLKELDKFFVLQSISLRKIVVAKSSGRTSELSPLLIAISNTAHGISILSESLHLNESFMLSRGLLERVINGIYLLYCDEDEYERYGLHALQKAYRSLNKEFIAGDMGVRFWYEGEIDTSKNPVLGEALKAFTSKSGKPITHWTSKSISQRIELIKERSKANINLLLLANLTFYDNSSEALHGSLFGCTFHIGLYEPGKKISSPEEFDKHLIANYTMVFWVGGLLMHQLIKCICKEASLDELYEEAKKSLDDAEAIMVNVL